MKVFNNRHVFALYCLCEIVKDDLRKEYTKEFKQKKAKCKAFDLPFVFDDFVIKFWSYYFVNNRFKCPDDAML